MSTDFPSTLVFEHPTLKSIVGWLLSAQFLVSSLDDVTLILTTSAQQFLGTLIREDEPLMAAGLDSLAGTQFVQAVTA